MKKQKVIFECMELTMIKKTTVLLGTLFLTTLMLAQSPNDVIGKWKTIDDNSGEAKSILELYKKGGKLYGKVVKILNPEKVDNVCDLCEDYRKGKPVLGMEILMDMEWDEDEWENGTILDPENGSVYDCKLWLEEGNRNELFVRGYIAFLYRTQNWYRITD